MCVVVSALMLLTVVTAKDGQANKGHGVATVRHVTCAPCSCSDIGDVPWQRPLRTLLIPT